MPITLDNFLLVKSFQTRINSLYIALSSTIIFTGYATLNVIIGSDMPSKIIALYTTLL